MTTSRSVLNFAERASAHGDGAVEINTFKLIRKLTPVAVSRRSMRATTACLFGIARHLTTCDVCLSRLKIGSFTTHFGTLIITNRY